MTKCLLESFVESGSIEVEGKNFINGNKFSRFEPDLAIYFEISSKAEILKYLVFLMEFTLLRCDKFTKNYFRLHKIVAHAEIKILMEMILCNREIFFLFNVNHK